MSTREVLGQLLDQFPDERLGQVLDYARYLSWQEERREWKQSGREHFARAYGSDEPDYTEADLLKDEPQ